MTILVVGLLEWRHNSHLLDFMSHFVPIICCIRVTSIIIITSLISNLSLLRRNLAFSSLIIVSFVSWLVVRIFSNIIWVVSSRGSLRRIVQVLKLLNFLQIQRLLIFLGLKKFELLFCEVLVLLRWARIVIQVWVSSYHTINTTSIKKVLRNNCIFVF